ncbi:MAG: serine kinase [Alphaproteobacteria bacterium]|nr:serine kinase [Alphaproteobacteria bacterium]
MPEPARAVGGTDRALFAASSPAETYYAQVSALFERAVAATSDIRRYYKLGPEILCIRFAGEGLMTMLTPALAHVEVGPAAPSLTVHCWDSATTGVTMGAPPWPGSAFGPKGHIEGYNNDAVRTVYQPGADVLNMMHVPSRTGIYWIRDPDILPYWECSFPMRALLHWWSRERPFQLVHAGAVGNEKGGVLLTGKSGSGKSTTAMSCLNSPLGYAGDDYVMIANEPQPYVYSLYNTAKLVPEGVGLLPGMTHKISNPQNMQDEKAMFFLQEYYPEKLSPGFPVKAIFLPRVTHQRDTRLLPATQGEALFALAPTTVLHLEGDSKLAFEKMSRFVQSVSSYWLEVGTDMAQIPETIRMFLEQA